MDKPADRQLLLRWRDLYWLREGSGNFLWCLLDLANMLNTKENWMNFPLRLGLQSVLRLWRWDWREELQFPACSARVELTPAANSATNWTQEWENPTDHLKRNLLLFRNFRYWWGWFDFWYSLYPGDRMVWPISDFWVPPYERLWKFSIQEKQGEDLDP